jgi:2-deoxy-D-gluconate 3-dehydrogenase
MIDAAIQAFGRVDILVNNAGTNIRKQPQEYSVEEWHTVIDTNLSSAFLGCQAAYPAMVRAGGGKIVNIGSMMSIFGAPFAAPYGASKGGLVQLTRSLATAWARDNIQVNAVLPGWIDTDLTRNARAHVPGLQDRVVARTPAGRWGAPDDLAGIAVFLASPASDFITGTAIPVDGGYSIQGV